jgi:tetrahydromethanopterin S-methyltransferase subunit G
MDGELLQAIKELFVPIHERLDKMDGRLDKMDGRLDKMDGRLDRLEAEIRKTNIIIENEIRHNIQLIAEGHIALTQRLDRIEKKVNKIDGISDDVFGLKNWVKENSELI